MPAYDTARVEAAVRELLDAIGEDVEREGLRETPARVARMYAEVFSGLHADPLDLVLPVFDEQHDELIIVKDIPLASFCEHHLVPVDRARRRSATCPARTAGSPGCPSWPGWSTCTPSGRRCRSG